MEQKIEREISELLKRWSNTEKVAEILSDRLEKSELPIAHELAIMSFLLQSGYLKLLFNPLLKRLQNDRPTSWLALIEIMSRNDVKPNREALNSIFEGALKHQMLENLILSHGWDNYDTRFQKLRDELRKRLQDEILQKKNTLKEKLGFLANHRMIEEEERILESLLNMFPEDQEIQAYQLGFKERWARNILSTSNQNYLTPTTEERMAIKWTENETALLDSWLATAKKISDARPEMAYMFTIFFIFAEAWEQALQILSLAPPSKNRDWLRLDILIHCRLFVDCLSEVDQTEMTHSDDPETSFSAAYTRAHALHGLGQHTAAMEILQSIIEIRPNYRSAQTLLAEWTEGIR